MSKKTAVTSELATVELEQATGGAFAGVNSQITDSVTQANVKVLGDSPAIALGNLYQATAQALANAAHNATTAQQQATITAQAATAMGVSTLLSVETDVSSGATKKILGS
ncbi:MAG: RebB family R body protein [Negativicutes bacterium]|jgi:hypothetical protein